MRRALVGLLTASVFLIALALAGGLGGRYAPASDTFAVFRGGLGITAIVLTACLVVLEAPLRATFAGLVAAFALGSLIPYWMAPQADRPPEDALTLYQKNMSYRLESVDQILVDIGITDADVVTLQEVTPANRALLARLPAEYVTRHWCPFNSLGGVAVASVFPEIEGSRRCVPGEGVAEVRVQSPNGPLRLVSLHLHWPWPHEQFQQIERLIPDLENDGTPMVIGGDFNMVRWSWTMRRIAAAPGTRPVGRVHVTLPFADLPLAGLSIDHVLAPGPGMTEVRRLNGSDHLGLLARFTVSG